MPPTPRYLKSTALASLGVTAGDVADTLIVRVKKLAEPDPVDINKALWQIQQLYRVEASRGLSPAFEKILLSFVDDVVKEARKIYGRSNYIRSAKADEPELPESLHIAIWESALQAASAKATLETGLELSAVHQKVTGEVYEKTSVLLDNRPSVIAEAEVASRYKGRLAGAMSSIVTTTKKAIRKAVKDALSKRMGIRDILSWVRDKATQRVKNRLGTISRTEAVKATNAGVTLAAKHSWVATHVSVVGCQMIEPKGPLFKGIPTCNIQNVPVNAEAGLEFHINHTGFFVISGFAREDGTAPVLELRGG
jgi:hypothetical protein